MRGSFVISREWKEDKKVFSVPNNILEDFTVIKEKEKYIAYYTKGASFGNQSLYKSYANNPLGPFIDEELVMSSNHLRICKGVIDESNELITMVFCGLPKTALFLLKRMKWGIIRKPLITPKYGTLYSVVAANPTVIHDGEDYNIYFEGSTKSINWHVFQAVWDGKDKVKVIDEALMRGANPFITKFNGRNYLYYSKHKGNGFETWVMTQ